MDQSDNSFTMENNSLPQNVVSLSGYKSPDTFSHPLSVKLDDKNFLLWKQQILAAINDHDLGVYIEGKNAVPDQSSSESGINKINYYYHGYFPQCQKVFLLVSSDADQRIFCSTHSS